MATSLNYTEGLPAPFGDFTIAILSYNRGGYLLNCVESCQRNMPGCSIRIYDDQSDDRATLDTLDKVREMGCEIFSSEAIHEKERQIGRAHV